jgi:hypothetical protein
MNPLDRRAWSLGIRGFVGIVAVYFWSVIASAEPPSPAELLPSKYLGSEYTIIEQANNSFLIKKNTPKVPQSEQLKKLHILQYDSFINRPDCNGGRANSSGQITEQSGQIIQQRFRMGMYNGKEFKLHVLTDPTNPSSANKPLFWYHNLDNQIGINKEGDPIYERVFINEEHYTYLPEDHPIRKLAKLPPQEPLPPSPGFWTFKGAGVTAASLGSGYVVGNVVSYATTETLTSRGMARENAQHYGAGSGFGAGWMAGEGVAAKMTGGPMVTAKGVGGLAISGPAAALATHTHIMTSEICPNINRWAEAVDRENAMPTNGKFMKAEFDKRREEYETAEEVLWGYGLGSYWYGVKYWTGYGPKGGIGGGW